MVSPVTRPLCMTFSALLLLLLLIPVSVCAATPMFPNVKLMIVIPETHITRVFTDPAAETEITGQFVNAGYFVIDQVHASALRQSNQLEDIMRQPTGPAARVLMAKYGADILIIGEGVSELTGPRTTGGVFSCRARVELKAIMREDGQIVSAVAAHGSGADAAEFVAAKIALRSAGAQLAPQLMQRIGDLTKGPVPATALAGTGAGGALPTIAVLPFEDQATYEGRDKLSLNLNLPDRVSAALVNEGKDICTVLDRTSVEAVAAEQKANLSGLFDNTKGAQELGTLLKADYVVMGRIINVTQKTKFYGLAGLGGYQETESTVTLMLKMLELKTGVVRVQQEIVGSGKRKGVALALAGIVFGSKEFENSALGKAVSTCTSLCGEALVDGLPFVCANCSAQCSRSDKFCPNCGKEPQPTPTVCAHCKATVKAGAKFCTKCGKPMPTKQ